VATTLVVFSILPQPHALLCPLQIPLQLSAAQSWCSLERSGYDARCFSMHRLNPRIALSCRFTAAQLQHSLGATWSMRIGYDTRFSMHASTTHMHCFVLQIHCSSVQHSLGAAWSVRATTLVVSACTLSIHTCIALSTADPCSSGAAQSWCGWA
jgi:hypothetical protein